MLTPLSYYSPDIARLLADCSRAAYNSGDALKRDTESLGLINLVAHSEPSTDTQAFTAKRSLFPFPEVIVAFRGTESLRDWITDAEFSTQDLGDGAEVHLGFHQAWMSIRARVMESLPKDKSPVLFTGHSLGGALATVAAISAVSEGVNVAGVYTFGQPRVGNSVWAKAYDQALKNKTWRLVNRQDPVPRMPPALAGYRHVGNEVFFDALGERVLNPSLWWKIGSDLLGTIDALRHRQLAALPNHFMERYIELTN